MVSVSPVESISFVILSERCVFDVDMKKALEKWSMKVGIYFFGDLLLEKFRSYRMTLFQEVPST